MMATTYLFNMQKEKETRCKMPKPKQISQNEYEIASAILSHATLTKSVEMAYPNMPPSEQDALIVGIIDRMARMRGWMVRREFVLEDESE
jgi:hypothetical protein